jgi:hypothetical protein
MSVADPEFYQHSLLALFDKPVASITLKDQDKIEARNGSLLINIVYGPLDPSADEALLYYGYHGHPEDYQTIKTFSLSVNGSEPLDLTSLAPLGTTIIINQNNQTQKDGFYFPNPQCVGIHGNPLTPSSIFTLLHEINHLKYHLAAASRPEGADTRRAYLNLNSGSDTKLDPDQAKSILVCERNAWRGVYEQLQPILDHPGSPISKALLDKYCSLSLKSYADRIKLITRR